MCFIAFVLESPYAESSLRDRQLARAFHRDNLLMNITQLFLRELFRKEPSDTFSFTRCIAKLMQAPRDSGEGIGLPLSNLLHLCLVFLRLYIQSSESRSTPGSDIKHVTKAAA